MSTLILGRYTKQSLWSLFLMCALPLHAWTMLLAFRDLSWLTDRTNAWDAVGVLCYGLLFALAESILVFLVASLLGLLIPKGWEPGRRTALLGTLTLVLALWAVVVQLFFLLELQIPLGIIDFLVRSGHPARYIYGVLVPVVAITFLLPAWAALRRGGGLKFLGGMIDRLGLLAMFYLVFDIPALVIVIIRNI